MKYRGNFKEARRLYLSPLPALDNIWDYSDGFLRFEIEDLFDDFQLAEHTHKRFYSAVHLFVCVVCHKGDAHKRICGVTSGRHHRIDEDTGFKCHSSGCKCLFEVTHIERNDRTLCVANFKNLLL